MFRVLLILSLQPACFTLNRHEGYGQLSAKPLRGAEGSESCHAAKAGPQCQAAMHGTAEGEGCCCPIQGGAIPCNFNEHVMFKVSAQSLLAGRVPHRCQVLPGCHGDVNVPRCMPDCPVVILQAGEAAENKDLLGCVENELGLRKFIEDQVRSACVSWLPSRAALLRESPMQNK